MMNPVPWLQMTNMISYQGLVRTFPNSFPDEIPAPENYAEGAKKQVTVNSYERDPRARQACIDHHGTSCKCCSFDFEKVYGEHGKGFIHVHHIKPLHTVGED
ncbi:HNH endonuclease, partial [Escherichia coli]|uniref:HNH endonuclease n=1 Tax=Escherichia coli TaxID=562 RepID=UPI003D81A596